MLISREWGPVPAEPKCNAGTHGGRPLLRVAMFAPLLLAGCGAALTHDATPPVSTAVASEPTSGSEPAAVPASPTCAAVSKSKRTYVGLSDGMTLDDFGDAAYESERIIETVRAHLCTARAGELDAALERAIATVGVEIIEVQYTRDDMSAAHARVRTRHAAAPSASAEIVVYGLDLAQSPSAWTIVAITRE